MYSIFLFSIFLSIQSDFTKLEKLVLYFIFKLME